MESNICKVSDLMNKAQNILIVPHPKRASTTLDIENIENAEILFDAPDVSECNDDVCEANEDPYIWNNNFLYTFCHVTPYRLKNVKPKDLIIFVSWNNNDINNMFIDTIMTCKYNVSWPVNVNNINLEELCNTFNKYVCISSDTLRHHIPKIKNGKLTSHIHDKYYSIVGDEKNSFIPLNRELKPIKLNNKKLCKQIEKLVRLPTSKNRKIDLNAKPKGNRQLTFLTKEQMHYDDNKEVKLLINDLLKSIDDQTNNFVYGKDLIGKRKEALKNI